MATLVKIRKLRAEAPVRRSRENRKSRIDSMLYQRAAKGAQRGHTGYDRDMLVLFDIDGTLLRTDGAGLEAMQEAAQELLGTAVTFGGIPTAGRLDPLIWRDLAALNGIADADGIHDVFRTRYAAHLGRRLRESGCARIMPGVAELVTTLQGVETCVLGLLTGNYEETGRMKVEAIGLEPEWFPVTAWGDEGSHRRDLPPVAMRRYEAHVGRSVPPEKVVIIGDTPHDVDCAKAHGCRVIGVATGMYGAAELADAGADLAVEDLSDAAGLAAWVAGE